MRLKVKKIPWFLSWKGLLWQKPQPVFFQTRFGIHTFGMRSAIDVVIVDSKGIIKKLKQNLKPNSLFFWNPKFDRVVELPVGTIRKKGINKGFKLILLT